MRRSRVGSRLLWVSLGAILAAGAVLLIVLSLPGQLNAFRTPSQIVAAELSLTQDWEKRMQEKRSEYDVLIASIVADAEVYAAEERARGEAEAVISEANGQLALEKVGALLPVPPETPERSTLKDVLKGATSVPSVAARTSVAPLKLMVICWLSVTPAAAMASSLRLSLTT